MALDYGERRIGVAVSDPTGTLAQPHETIDRGRSGAGLGGALARIKSLASELGVERIVVGLPIRMSGRPGPEAEAARRFGERVRTETGVPVDYLDERWTTREAERALREIGARGSRARGRVDATAAALLLRAYLARGSR
jgi:putative Holliday junction resolvase